MAGLLTHLVISIIGFLIGTFIFKNWRYGIGFAIGHLTPDLISFGITGLRQGSLNPSVIMTNSWFRPLVWLGHTPMNWIIFGMVVFVILSILYYFNAISKKNHKIWSWILVFFLAGIFIHLLIDKLVVERTYWV